MNSPYTRALLQESLGGVVWDRYQGQSIHHPPQRATGSLWDNPAVRVSASVRGVHAGEGGTQGQGGVRRGESWAVDEDRAGGDTYGKQAVSGQL